MAIDHENEKGTLNTHDFYAFDTLDALIMNSDFYMSEDMLDTIEWYVDRWKRQVAWGKKEFRNECHNCGFIAGHSKGCAVPYKNNS